MMTGIGREMIRHCGRPGALWGMILLAGVLLWGGSPSSLRAAGVDEQARAPLCLDPAQSHGWRVRVLQTQLMVAALSCRGRRADGHVALYNEIVRTRRAELRQAAEHFRRAAARMGGAGAVDRLVTEIANRVTRQALEEPDFCARSAALARAIRAVPDAPLDLFTDMMPVRLQPPLATCPGSAGPLVADE